MPGWKRALWAANVQERILYNHFALAFAKGRRTLPPEAVADHQEAEVVLNHAVEVTDEAMRSGLPRLLFDALSSGGDVAATNLVLDLGAATPLARAAVAESDLYNYMRALAPPKGKPPKGYAFNKSNVAAETWAREHAGELIDGITKTTRDELRDVIGDVLSGDSTWKSAFTRIDKIFDDPARARTIARTESARAINEGQKKLWNQAVKDDYLTGKELMVWITTPDACDICDAMDGETVELGEDFEEDGPPAHPNCRCTVGLVV
jgi:SPP1 gp7 family putative phage head morphogenesis protein